MSEIYRGYVCFCDFCNPQMNFNLGRGFCECSAAQAIVDFSWKRIPHGRLMCVECQARENRKVCKSAFGSASVEKTTDRER